MQLTDFPKIILANSKASDGNMSFVKGDPEQALENRQNFLNLLGINLDSIVSMYAQHGVEVIKVGKDDLGKGAHDSESAFKVDGLVTNEPGVNMFLMTADCLPVVFYDPQRKALGLIHAGWKGLHLGILESAIKSFKQHFESNPQKLLVHIAPSIGPCCYIKQNTKEVEANPKWHPYLKKADDGISIDLWNFAQDQLVSLGIKQENIENSKICTYHSNQYFSNRKFNVENLSQDFRFATVLGLKP
ncbi:MAG: polyphenol oxidase family protein [bacterium]|nr:polyphenol oxidase family protein [bacterium]